MLLRPIIHGRLLNWGYNMKRQDLFDRVAAFKSETQAALQTMYDALNKGQQKKIVKNEKVKALFDRYGVTYTE